MAKTVTNKISRSEARRTRKVVDVYKFWDSANTFRVTSADQDITFEGNVYTPAAISRGSTEHSADMKVSVLKIDAHYLEDYIVDYLTSVPIEPIWVQVIKVYMDQDTPDGLVYFIGQIAQVHFKGQKATLRCEGLEKLLMHRVPRYRFQPKCNWPLYSSYAYAKSTVGAKAMDEKFENASGTDETWPTSWLPQNYNLNYPSPVGGWGSLCGRFVRESGALEGCYLWTGPSEPYDMNIAYFRVEVILQSEDISSGNVQNFAQIRRTINAAAAEIGVKNDGGDLKFQLGIKHDGSSVAFYLSPEISTGVKYRVELKWDTVSGLWAWRVDGAQQDAGTLTGVAASWNIGGILVGATQGTFSGAHDAFTVLLDNIAYNENGWNGSDEWQLGCTVSQASYTHTISVTGVSSDGLELTGDFSGQGSGYFDYGWAEYDGHKRMITNNDETTVYLRYPISGLNDAACPTNVDFVAGCDKLQTTCDTKFDNMDRFLGFTKMPQDNPCMWTGE